MLNESHWTWTQQRKGKNYGQGKTLTRRNHPKLRGVEVHVSRSLKAEEASRKEGITEQTFYRWRKKFWGCVSTKPNG